VFLAAGVQLDLDALVGHAVVMRGTLTKHESQLILIANQAAVSHREAGAGASCQRSKQASDHERSFA